MFSQNNEVFTYDLNPPLSSGDAPPVDLANGVGGISVVGKPDESKARGVTRDPHLPSRQRAEAQETSTQASVE